ncbi:MAG: helicase-related protein [Bacillus sp. (in: firmicutes)]
MNKNIEKNITLAKERFMRVLRSEAFKYIDVYEEQAAPDKFIEENAEHLYALFEKELAGNILNGLSKLKKRELLKTQGDLPEIISSKKLNAMARDLLLQSMELDYKKWICEYYVRNPQKWEEYKKEAIVNKRKEAISKELKEEAAALLYVNNLILYLPLRSQIADEIAQDAKSTKYELDDRNDVLVECGPFQHGAYFKVEDFSAEYTGHTEEVYGSHCYTEFETYFDKYKSMVEEYVYGEVPSSILQQLSEEGKRSLFDLFSKDELQREISEWLDSELYDTGSDYLYRLMDELMEDMRELSGMPFDTEMHRGIYMRQLAERRKKIDEQKREEKRLFEQKKVERMEKERKEEEMILQMIGKEYERHVYPNTKYILHIGETNTGKTHTALKEMSKASTGLYLGPLRLLALEVYETLSKDGIRCGLKTGEEEKALEGATHISATVEMFTQKERYECVVIDEAQMIADKDRGFAWYKAITSVQADTVHIIGSRNAKNMLLQLLEGNGVEVLEYRRTVPLIVQKKKFKISQAAKGDALIVFSRKKVLQVAAKLENDGHKASVVYGGMPPETRQKQIEQFHRGETEMVVSTDAIGMGLNLPIRRVVFLENEKYDGTKRRTLTSQEIKQISGRAGRKGKYEEGFVAFSYDVKKMAELLEKKDENIEMFAISPTQNIFNRFSTFHKDLAEFFRLWKKYNNPKGTIKSPLTQEQELYEEIRGTRVEAKLPMAELYSFLHLPFSTREQSLKDQWKWNMFAMVDRQELQEPIIRRNSLDQMELSYKAIGLHLLFLYRLDRRTEAALWERMRDEISGEIHGLLKKDMKKYRKKCKFCGQSIEWDYQYNMCQTCHSKRYGNHRRYEDW